MAANIDFLDKLNIYRKLDDLTSRIELIEKEIQNQKENDSMQENSHLNNIDDLIVYLKEEVKRWGKARKYHVMYSVEESSCSARMWAYGDILSKVKKLKENMEKK